MKGNKELLTVLNSLLADELTAINQYIDAFWNVVNWDEVGDRYESGLN